MYVVIEDYPYESIVMLGASESKSKAEEFLEKVKRKHLTNHARQSYIYNEVAKLHAANPLLDQGPVKPPFDQSRAHDKEYVKSRNENEIKEYHRARTIYCDQVLRPYNEMMENERKKIVEASEKMTFEVDLSQDTLYKIIQIDTI